jgi:ribosomal protein S27E
MDENYNWKTCERCIASGGRVCGVNEKKGVPAVCADLRAEANARLYEARVEREGLYPVIDDLKRVRAILEAELLAAKEDLRLQGILTGALRRACEQYMAQEDAFKEKLAAAETAITGHKMACKICDVNGRLKWSVERIAELEAKLTAMTESRNNYARSECKLVDRTAELEYEVEHLTLVIETAKEAINNGWNPIWELEAVKPSGDGKGARGCHNCGVTYCISRLSGPGITDCSDWKLTSEMPEDLQSPVLSVTCDGCNATVMVNPTRDSVKCEMCGHTTKHRPVKISNKPELEARLAEKEKARAEVAELWYRDHKYQSDRIARLEAYIKSDCGELLIGVSDVCPCSEKFGNQDCPLYHDDGKGRKA